MLGVILKVAFYGWAAFLLAYFLFLGKRALFKVGRFASCNDQLAEIQGKLLSDTSDSGRSMPWANYLLSKDGRILAWQAIRNGEFGVTRNKRGVYRYYYRKSLTGNWFAEVWPVWKSALFAAPFLNPEFLRLPMQYRYHFEAGESALVFLAGLYLVLMFLPRALLGASGVHYRTISLLGNTAGWESAGVINFVAGLSGLSMMLIGWQHGLDFGACFDLVVSKVTGFVSGGSTDVTGKVFLAIVIALTAPFIFAVMGMGVPLVMGWVFWMGAVRWHSAHAAVEDMVAKPFLDDGQVEAFYRGTRFEVLHNPEKHAQMGQVGVLVLVWWAFLVGIVLNPFVRMVVGWFG